MIVLTSRGANALAHLFQLNFPRRPLGGETPSGLRAVN